MKKKDLIEMIDKLKVCIDEGHDFEFVQYYPQCGSATTIEWKCRKCDYHKTTKATEEQELILMKYKTLKPQERAK